MIDLHRAFEADEADLCGRGWACPNGAAHRCRRRLARDVEDSDRAKYVALADLEGRANSRCICDAPQLAQGYFLHERENGSGVTEKCDEHEIRWRR